MRTHKPKSDLAAALADIDRARAKVAQLIAGPEGSVEDPFKPASKLGLAAWRAAHRAGNPSKLDTDPDLRAFVLDRIETLTYDQIVQAVAAAFPPERRTSTSALSRWFRRQNRAPRTATIG